MTEAAGHDKIVSSTGIRESNHYRLSAAILGIFALVALVGCGLLRKKIPEEFLADRCKQFSQTDFFADKEKSAVHTDVWTRTLTQYAGKSESENR